MMEGRGGGTSSGHHQHQSHTQYRMLHSAPSSLLLNKGQPQQSYQQQQPRHIPLAAAQAATAAAAAAGGGGAGARGKGRPPAAVGSVRLSHGGAAHTVLLSKGLPLPELRALLASIFALAPAASGHAIVGLRAHTPEATTAAAGSEHSSSSSSNHDDDDDVVIPLSLACRHPERLTAPGGYALVLASASSSAAVAAAGPAAMCSMHTHQQQRFTPPPPPPQSREQLQDDDSFAEAEEEEEPGMRAAGGGAVPCSPFPFHAPAALRPHHAFSPFRPVSSASKAATAMTAAAAAATNAIPPPVIVVEESGLLEEEEDGEEGDVDSLADETLEGDDEKAEAEDEEVAIEAEGGPLHASPPFVLQPPPPRPRSHPAAHPLPLTGPSPVPPPYRPPPRRASPPLPTAGAAPDTAAHDHDDPYGQQQQQQPPPPPPQQQPLPFLRLRTPPPRRALAEARVLGDGGGAGGGGGSRQEEAAALGRLLGVLGEAGLLDGATQAALHSALRDVEEQEGDGGASATAEGMLEAYRAFRQDGRLDPLVARLQALVAFSATTTGAATGSGDGVGDGELVEAQQGQGGGVDGEQGLDDDDEAAAGGVSAPPDFLNVIASLRLDAAQTRRLRLAILREDARVMAALRTYQRTQEITALRRGLLRAALTD